MLLKLSANQEFDFKTPACWPPSLYSMLIKFMLFGDESDLYTVIGSKGVETFIHTFLNTQILSISMEQ